MKLRIVTVFFGLMALVAGWSTLRHTSPRVVFAQNANPPAVAAPLTEARVRELQVRVEALERRINALESKNKAHFAPLDNPE
jgi:hypothetical protein